MDSSKALIKFFLVLILLTMYVSGQEFLSPLDRAGIRGLAGNHPAHGIPFRRIDCAVFCRKTGFTGLAGGCNCGFTLFTKRSGHQPLESGSSGDMNEDEQDMLHFR